MSGENMDQDTLQLKQAVQAGQALVIELVQGDALHRKANAAIQSLVAQLRACNKAMAEATNFIEARGRAYTKTDPVINENYQLIFSYEQGQEKI